MEILNAIFYFIIVIFVLVSVHEFGHFIAARIFGMHVPVYSIGMGRRLLGFNKFSGFSFGPLQPEVESQLGKNTDYRLSLLPLGGYAKIDGMIDETQTSELPTEVQPWEFRAKPWWQKSIVICAGVIMNLIIAGLFFGLIRYIDGETIMATTKIEYVSPNSLSAKKGIQAGDEIRTINGQQVRTWNQVETIIIQQNYGNDVTLTLDRAGQPFRVVFPTAELGRPDQPTVILKNIGLLPIGYGPTAIDGVTASQPADRLGLQKNDQIIAVNGEKIDNSQSLIDHISANPEKEITIDWVRNGKVMSGKVRPNYNGKIGIMLKQSSYTGPSEHRSFGLGQSLLTGFKDIYTNGVLFIKNIAMIFTGKVSAKSALGGPVKIAAMAGQTAAAGVTTFFMFMALLSLSLAFINILPLPALDGGHLFIILVEAMLGHELSQRFKMGFQKVGVALILLLITFTVLNDTGLLH